MKKETYLKLKNQKRKAKLLGILTALSLFAGMTKDNKVSAATYESQNTKEQILELILEKAIPNYTGDTPQNEENYTITTTPYKYEHSSTYSSKNNTDIAHRGYAPGGVYENSADAFKLAGEYGFWGCEADVRFDKNGNLVCSHDPVKSGQNPPSFQEYLRICEYYGMTAIIDLKYEKGPNLFDEKLSPSILATIKKMGMIDNCILQTNNPTDVPYIRENSSDARIWYLTDVISDSNIEMIKENNVECVNIEYNYQNGINQNRINKLTNNGIDVCVWNAITETHKNSVLNMGATYVMSDNLLCNTKIDKNIVNNLTTTTQDEIILPPGFNNTLKK